MHGKAKNVNLEEKHLSNDLVNLLAGRLGVQLSHGLHSPVVAVVVVAFGKVKHRHLVEPHGA